MGTVPRIGFTKGKEEVRTHFGRVDENNRYLMLKVTAGIVTHSANTTSEMNVARHDGDSLSMNGA